MIGEERKSECEQMLRVCAGLRLWRNAGGPSQSPSRILRGFSAQFLAPDNSNRGSGDQSATARFAVFSSLCSSRYHKLHVFEMR